MGKGVYKYWTREQLFNLLLKQASIIDLDPVDLRKIVFCKDWEPKVDFNGCNFVQDRYHPFLPCFIHDYRYIVEGPSNKVDLEFKSNLIKIGFSNFKAWSYYLGVRLGYYFYYKWLKR